MPKLKKPKPDLPEKKCEHCDNTFIPNRFWQKHCSRDCTQAAHWERKSHRIKAIRGLDQIDEMMRAPPSSPTPEQLAEWKRREDIAIDTPARNAEDKRREDLARAEAVVRQAEKLTEPSALERLFGKEK
jgi:hypothetical protein